MKKHNVIGILGGMGPKATIDLYNRIIEQTTAKCDNDHISTLIFSNPKIPDRVHSFQHRNQHLLVQYLQETAKTLEKGGADVILLPCNSAHFCFLQIQEVVSIPVLNMIEETSNYIFRTLHSQKCTALLGTPVTYNTRLYHDYLESRNIEVLEPTDKEKALILELIYKIKKGESISEHLQPVSEICNKWEAPIIMGCTELPLISDEIMTNNNLINPTEILANAAINFVSKQEMKPI